ncbi:MAG: hypothetical protein GTO40_31080 [Deltaproteobacteria bacterium]|nr:hypothetical protein [Deltaproteobacteria bacterium]
MNRLKQEWLLGIAFVCFFLSGMSGLIYEVVWTRMLTQVFGNTTYAVATVLTAFMGGLALGSWLFGLLADRGKNNFLLYGILEACIGVYGFAVPWLFKLVQWLYGPLFFLSERYPFLFSLSVFLMAFLFLMFPTILMGATLPVLSRFFIGSFNQVGRRVGDLYATNTMGAVLGCAAAGYWLIPAMGMQTTVYVAAILNLLIALVIFAIDRKRDKEYAFNVATSDPVSLEKRPLGAVTSLGWILLVSIGLSGFAALVYENSWTRALTMVIGSSVYSFTTMLVTFLVGLALGGFLYARLLGKREVGLSLFGFLQISVGLTAVATIPLFEKLPLLFLRLLFALGDSFSLFLSIQLFLCVLVMLLPTVLLGMTFPLVAQLFTRDLYRVGSSVGISYAANTLGAILGAFTGGFILIPWVGVQNSIILGAVLNFTVGWLLLVLDPRAALQRRFAVGAVVMMGLVLVPLKIPRWDPRVITSGVSIYDGEFEETYTDFERLEKMRRDEIVYYKEGLTATISVHRSALDYLYFKTNGKVDGSHGDALTQLMIGYIPLFLHPTAKNVAVIGLGTGMTAKAVGAFPTREIEILEIEPAMSEVAGYFNDYNENILDDPRVRLIFADGRNYILATPKHYDVITSEPSNPWIAGVANLYTREFYEVVKSKLTREGLFAQWFHNYSMSLDDFRMVFRTFGEVFPFVSVWELAEQDYLLVGSKEKQQFDFTAAAKVYSGQGVVSRDFDDLGLTNVREILSYYRMGKKELMAFSKGAQINTDDGAQLEYSAPKNVGFDIVDEIRDEMEPFTVSAPWMDSEPGLLLENIPSNSN